MIPSVSIPDFSAENLYYPQPIGGRNSKSVISSVAEGFVSRAIEGASSRNKGLIDERMYISPCGIASRPSTTFTTPVQEEGALSSKLRDTVNSFRSVIYSPLDPSRASKDIVLPSKKELYLNRMQGLILNIGAAQDLQAINHLKSEFVELELRVLEDEISDLSETCRTMITHLNLAEDAERSLQKLEPIKKKTLSSESLTLEDFIEIKEVRKKFNLLKTSVKNLKLSEFILNRCNDLLNSLDQIKELDALLGKFILLESEFEGEWRDPSIDLSLWVKKFLEVQEKARNHKLNKLDMMCEKYISGMDLVTAKSLDEFKTLKVKISLLDESTCYRKILKLKKEMKNFIEVQGKGFLTEKCNSAISNLDSLLDEKLVAALNYSHNTIKEFEDKFEEIAKKVKEDPSLRRNSDFRTEVGRNYFRPLYEKFYLRLENDLFCRAYYEQDRPLAEFHMYNYNIGMSNWKQLQIAMHDLLDGSFDEIEKGNEEGVDSSNAL